MYFSNKTKTHLILKSIKIKNTFGMETSTFCPNIVTNSVILKRFLKCAFFFSVFLFIYYGFLCLKLRKDDTIFLNEDNANNVNKISKIPIEKSSLENDFKLNPVF